jgi:hypothetical protein
MLDRLATTVHDSRRTHDERTLTAHLGDLATPCAHPGPCARTCQPGRAMGPTACTVAQNGLPAHHGDPRWFNRAAVTPCPPRCPRRRHRELGDRRLAATIAHAMHMPSPNRARRASRALVISQFPVWLGSAESRERRAPPIRVTVCAGPVGTSLAARS